MGSVAGSGETGAGRSMTRKASQAQTRARLIAVGREHFLRYGLGGAIAERIAVEAGFTRGALYANFADKDELFVAVVRSGVDEGLRSFQTILESPGTVKERFELFREAMGTLVTDPGWVLLQAEFQANALRSATIRAAFMEQQERRRVNGAMLLREFASQLGLRLSGTPEEVSGVLSGLLEALAVRLAIAGEPEAGKAKELAMLCFDRLVSAGRTDG